MTRDILLEAKKQIIKEINKVKKGKDPHRSVEINMMRRASDEWQEIEIAYKTQNSNRMKVACDALIGQLKSMRDLM